MKIDTTLSPESLRDPVARTFELAAKKTLAIDQTWDVSQGTPVFTVEGRYATRGWTEWTQGFQYGCALLVFDATGDSRFFELGRARTVERMAAHLTHTGVHDHGFNNISTYGNLRRLMREGRISHDPWELKFYELALMASGAVQASRWSEVADGRGYVYSFNGPHSLFVDTIRTVRILGLAHQLGHVLMGEGDNKISLLGRSVQHARATAAYNVYYGEGRDSYDVRGRTVHECVFNRNDGRFRCPSTQQGYSPFSTWTRGLAWAMLGFAEELEFLEVLRPEELEPYGGKAELLALYEEAARATCDFYIDHAAADGIVYWDTGAPGLAQLGDVSASPADPFNEFEPVDSSASAIGAQGLIRLGRYLRSRQESESGSRYGQAGLTVAKRLMEEPYLSTDENHQGLLLHSIYHRPNGWDFTPEGSKIPHGESSMWGDYHLLEVANLVKRMASGEPYPTFFDR